MLTTSLFDMVT